MYVFFRVDMSDPAADPAPWSTQEWLQDPEWPQAGQEVFEEEDSFTVIVLESDDDDDEEEDSVIVIESEDDDELPLSPLLEESIDTFAADVDSLWR